MFCRFSWANRALCFAAFVVLGAIVGCDTSSNVTPAAPVKNAAELLVDRCGKPDIDDSTAYDNPRPPIPSRLITYKKAHLMFGYIPGGDARIGDPPPYSWTLLGVSDTRTKKAIPAAQMKAVLTSRLPCALGN